MSWFIVQHKKRSAFAMDIATADFIFICRFYQIETTQNGMAVCCDFIYRHLPKPAPCLQPGEAIASIKAFSNENAPMNDGIIIIVAFESAGRSVRQLYCAWIG